MDNIFRKAIDDVTTPVYMTKAQDIVDYYKDAYGAKNWSKKIVDDIMALPDNKLKRGSINRQFEYDGKKGFERYKSPKMQSGWLGRFKQLGEKLPPVGRKFEKDSINFVITGTQSAGAGRPRRNRTIRVTLSGDKAREWVDKPNWDDIWDEYGYDFGENDEDNDYSLHDVSVSAS